MAKREKPLIGVTTSVRTVVSERSGSKISVPSFASPCSFSDLLHECGAVPLLLPSIADEETVERYLDLLDGILFSGGHDVHPSRMNRPPAEGAEYDLRKDEFELALIGKVLERDLPALCVCRGHQLLNVALGGTLHQDVPHLEGHQRKGDGLALRHRIRIVDRESVLGRVAGGEELLVNSFHHQGIERLADGLRVTAEAEDGLIEGVEASGKRFVVGVQFHPEFSRPDETAAGIEIVRAFVEATVEAMTANAGRGGARHDA